jgi:hypothetical protein
LPFYIYENKAHHPRAWKLIIINFQGIAGFFFFPPSNTSLPPRKNERGFHFSPRKGEAKIE